MSEENGNVGWMVRAGRKRGIADRDTRAATKAVQPDQIVRNLRSLGFPFGEIAKYDGRSSQWMSHLAKDSVSAAPTIKSKTADPETITREILGEACDNLAWWSPGRGRMIQDKVIARFRESGYTWKEARKHDTHTRADKLTVILLGTFGIGSTADDRTGWMAFQLRTLSKTELSKSLGSGELYFDIRPSQEHVKAWFRARLETLTKGQIFELINQGQDLEITNRAYVRTWNQLGLHAKIRQPRTTKT